MWIRSGRSFSRSDAGTGTGFIASLVTSFLIEFLTCLDYMHGILIIRCYSIVSSPRWTTGRGYYGSRERRAPTCSISGRPPTSISTWRSPTTCRALRALRVLREVSTNTAAAWAVAVAELQMPCTRNTVRVRRRHRTSVRSGPPLPLLLRGSSGPTSPNRCALLARSYRS